MVRLQESIGKFSLIVPRIKVERTNWNKGQKKDCRDKHIIRLGL